MVKTLASILLLIGIGSSSLSEAQTPQSAARKLEAFLDRFPDLGPGYAVVVVTPDEVLLRHVQGVLRASQQDAKITTDTPMYIASQTKAYIGVLAARLDAEGVLSLDDRITDHWPGVTFPKGVDPSRWKLRDLLTHQVPIKVDYITYVEKDIAELKAAYYPMLIARHAETRESGFEYANTGYNIWAAILETSTGKSWRQWLDEKVFRELGLKRTSTRTSDFKLEELPWRHIWQGKEKGWFEAPSKPDAAMQSAGGIVTSVNDMAIWLQAHLQGVVLKGIGITNEMIKTAHKTGTKADAKLPRTIELPCTGYALGWNICNFEGRELYVHGGGYPGVRSLMAFSPEMGAGIAVFANSDNATQWLNSRVVVQFYQYLIEDKRADSWARSREISYPKRIDRGLESRKRKLQVRFADPCWGDWKWQPTRTELGEFSGRYLSDPSEGPQIEAEVEIDADKINFAVGELRLWLKPAKPNLFASFRGPFLEAGHVRFYRNDKKEIVGFSWLNVKYKRVADR